MKPLLEVTPGILVIQTQIQARGVVKIRIDGRCLTFEGFEIA